jgi:hypothetical protein
MTPTHRLGCPPDRLPTSVARRCLGLVTVACLLVAALQPVAAGAPSGHPSSRSVMAAAPYVPAGWPTYGTTGVSTSRLPAIKGRTITRDGTVIQNRVINGQLTIKADNVTLRNVLVRSSGFYGVVTYGKKTYIADSTVVGTAPHTLAGIAGTEGGSFTARRVEVRGAEDGVRLTSNSILTGSLIHRLAGDDRTSHYDAVTADGYHGWQIRRNTILNHKGMVAAVWVGDSRYGPSSGLLADNYLAGGGFTIYAGTGSGSGIRVLRNVFSSRFHPRSGYWGLVYDWRGQNNVWADNRWIDGPRKGRLATP